MHINPWRSSHISIDIREVDVLYGTVAIDKIVFHIIAGLADTGLAVGFEVGQGVQIAGFRLLVPGY